MDLVLMSRAKTMQEHGNKRGNKTSPRHRLCDDLSMKLNLDENVSKMNEFLKVSCFQGARVGLKINVKKTMSLRLGISEGEEIMLVNKKTDQMDRFTYIDSAISKDNGCNEDIKSRIAMAQGVFFYS